MRRSREQHAHPGRARSWSTASCSTSPAGCGCCTRPATPPATSRCCTSPARVLVTGDSIWNVRGRMTWPSRRFCTDVAMAKKTAHVLGELDYDVAAFTHGPEIRQGAREAVRGFLRRRRQRQWSPQ